MISILHAHPFRVLPPSLRVVRGKRGKKTPPKTGTRTHEKEKDHPLKPLPESRPGRMFLIRGQSDYLLMRPSAGRRRWQWWRRRRHRIKRTHRNIPYARTRVYFPTWLTCSEPSFSHLPLPQSLKIMMAFRRWASTRASSQSAESTPLFFITPLHVPPTSLFVSNSFESEVEIPSFPSYRLSVPAFLTSFFFLFSLPRNFLAVSFVCGAISKHFFFGCCCSRRGALFKFLSHSGK